MKSIFTVLIFTNLLLASTGATLYNKCAGCHGADGEKSALGKSAAIGGQSKAKVIEQLKNYKAGTLNLYGMGALMKGQVAHMSDKEIADVATYIKQLASSTNKGKSSGLDLSTQVILCTDTVDDKKIKECLRKLLDNEKSSTSVGEESSSQNEILTKVANKGKWDTSIATSEIDDSQKVILTLAAENTIRSSYRTERPTLYLRCAENKTEAFISWNIFLGSDSTKVLLRYDKEKAKTRRWGLSTDHKATFVRGNIPFIKKILKHEKLLVQVTPYSDSPVTTTFDLRGLKEAIKPLRKACHW